MPRVLNKRDSIATPPNSFYVGRPSPWGNPFEMKGEADRDAVCDAFAEYAIRKLEIEPDWLRPLKGKDLVCWCAPKRCHADVLIDLANRPQKP